MTREEKIIEFFDLLERQIYGDSEVLHEVVSCRKVNFKLPGEVK